VADAEKTVRKALRSLLKRREGKEVDVSLDDGLYDQLQLDSLEVAELSAELEDELGTDPYSQGVVPRTVGEVVEFYDT
jgi:acyl carrier protein